MNAAFDNVPLHPAKGSFACHKKGCRQIFASAHHRNIHETSCRHRCARCGMTFRSLWRYECHMHEHATGKGHRCRMGCTTADSSESLWFDSDFLMRKHHEVEHGTSYVDACVRLGYPWGYEEPVPVPLVGEDERRANLKAWDAALRWRYDAHMETRTPEQAAAAAATTSAYKRNILESENEEQRAARLARNAVYNKACYDNMSDAQRDRRLERARGYDHIKRANESEKEREIRLGKKSEHERKRLARMTEEERTDLNVKRRATVKFANETEAEREARVAPRRIANKYPAETKEQQRARRAKRNESAKLNMEKLDPEEQESRREKARERNRRYRQKQKEKQKEKEKEKEKQ